MVENGILNNDDKFTINPIHKTCALLGTVQFAQIHGGPSLFRCFAAATPRATPNGRPLGWCPLFVPFDHGYQVIQMAEVRSACQSESGCREHIDYGLGYPRKMDDVRKGIKSFLKFY